MSLYYIPRNLQAAGCSGSPSNQTKGYVQQCALCGNDHCRTQK